MKIPILYFSKRERRGLIVLFMILIFITTIKYLILFHPGKTNSTKYERIKWKKQEPQVKKEGESIIAKHLISETNPNEFKKKRKIKPYSEDLSSKLFTFDPNNISEDSLNLLPINRYAKENLLKYRNKGGVFKNSGDVKKIYALGEDEFEIIKPFILISSRKFLKKAKTPKVLQRININTASEDLLMSLYGIGPVLSKRIIKYREIIGGFNNTNQLREVYGLQDSMYEKIKKLLLTDGLVEKIRINYVDYEDLSSHPYINRNIAKVIIKYRYQHGEFEDIEDLLKIKILNHDIINKIKPYLSFE